MKSGKEFTDEYSDYINGDDRTYKFDKKVNSFIMEYSDAKAENYKGIKLLSDLEIIEWLCEMNVMEFINQGFNV